MERKIDILIALFCIFSFLILGQQFVGAQVQILPISVNTGHLDFGLVFPGEFLEKIFTVSFVSDSGQDEINYSITQKIKPRPEATVPDGFEGTISEYCQENQSDFEKCYPNLCPFLTKTSEEGEGDLELNASVGEDDLSDNWLVGLQTPAIKGFVGQDHIGGIVDENGVYGCDIGINIFAEGEARCGDGIKNGTEACDGIDGVTTGWHCTASCVLEQNGQGGWPECGNGYVESGEQCDDGNLINGDGCSASCVAEGGGGNGPIGPSDAYQNWLQQQVPPGEVKGETTQNPTEPGEGGAEGEVKGASTFLPATGFDFNEFVILAMILLALIGLRVILKKKSAAVA